MRIHLKKLLCGSMALAMALTVLSGCGSTGASGSTGAGGSGTASAAGEGDPIEITLSYSDNATLPFKEDWLTIQEVQKRTNSKLKFEVIPIADYATKVSLMLNTGENVPDVILYQGTKGENASLALNGAIVPISDYSEWTPNFNAWVEKFGMEKDLDDLRLKDGKYYYMPSLFDVPFYDGGLILRQDFLEANDLEAPATYDDLYNILKLYKEQNPDSYPLTILSGPRVLYRMTMPAWGISLGKNSSSGSYVLSWDYDKQEYFAGATSEQFKEYLQFFAKLYAEGLLDPEMADPIDGDKWTQKMASGAAMATYAYYDQIGGVEASSTIDGFKLQMYPALAGPAGAHHQPKSRTGAGIMFPAKTAEREDFEQVVRTIDEIFFSEENAKLWCLGVEGVTYTEDENGNIVYSDEITSSPDGIYKTMQVKYGCGSDVTQMVWVNKREMTKYDENYAQINATVESMGDVIQGIPPTPMFDDLTSEEAGLLQTPLADTWERWTNEFLTGSKSLDTDWDTYVAEMQSKGIDQFCELYQSNMN